MVVKDTEKTPVIFKLEKDGSGDVFAAFPQQTGTYDWWTMGCYAHMGQHASADMGYVAECKPAHPLQYKDLFEELESLGYNLEIRRKITQRDNDIRKAELERIRAS